MCSYFDAHCDTLLKMYRENKSIFDETLMVNAKALSRYEKAVQCFSFFNDGSYTMSDYYDAAALMKKECERAGFSFCTCASDIDKCIKEGRIGAMLTAEALGNTRDFSVNNLLSLKKCGYSMIGLVWNYDNFLCGGCLGNNRGLTPLGYKTIKEMEKLSLAVDVSHISSEGFYNVCDNFCKPLVASHSNCRRICNHKRNLTDDQIRKIIASDGTVALCFYPCFVGGKCDDFSFLNFHFRHVINLGGERALSVGSDFDGIDKTPRCLNGCADCENLFEFLVEKTYTKSLVNDISFNNIYNVFKKYEICN